MVPVAELTMASAQNVMRLNPIPHEGAPEVHVVYVAGGGLSTIQDDMVEAPIDYETEAAAVRRLSRTAEHVGPMPTGPFGF